MNLRPVRTQRTVDLHKLYVPEAYSTFTIEGKGTALFQFKTKTGPVFAKEVVQRVYVRQGTNSWGSEGWYAPGLAWIYPNVSPATLFYLSSYTNDN